MDTTPLCVFATKARSSNRLLYGDLRRLQRDVLPTGATSRQEVEVLLSLDRIERLDRDWPRYLAMTVSEFVLSISDPPGSVDPETATWLARALADTRQKTGAAVVRTLMGDVHQIDDALLAFVRRGAKRPAMAEERDEKRVALNPLDCILPTSANHGVLRQPAGELDPSSPTQSA
jgi:hypothetical protein